MSYDSLLIQTCTVKRFAEGAADDYGHPVKTWADYLTDEPCRVTTPTGREIKVGVEIVLADHLIFLGDVAITEQDRIVIGAVTYEILLVADRQDGFASHHKECFVRTAR